MADITYKLNFTGDQINNLLTRTNNLDTELNNYLLKTGGTMTGAINMNGQPIFGLDNPIQETQVANKRYVDAIKTEANAYTDASVRKAAPRNLLDNSDFRNPVNQRGATSKDTTGYFIDRWIIQNSSTTASIDENGMNVYSDSNHLIYQRISEGVKVGKVYTFAVGLSDGTVGVISFELTTTTSSFAWLKSPLYITSALSIGVAHSSTIPLFVAFTNRQNSTIRTIWAALYEGSYTAETLPEYQPKGYGAELLECQRYFYRIAVSQYNRVGYGLGEGSTQHIVSFPIPVPMRAYSSVSLTGTIFINPGDILVTSFSAFNVQTGAEANVIISTKSPVTGFFRLRALESTTYINVIADL